LGNPPKFNFFLPLWASFICQSPIFLEIIFTYKNNFSRSPMSFLWPPLQVMYIQFELCLNTMGQIGKGIWGQSRTQKELRKKKAYINKTQSTTIHFIEVGVKWLHSPITSCFISLK
jgi:hypothetical protein